MASAARISSDGEERNGEAREVNEDSNQTQMMNKILGAVMEKLSYADPSKTFTPDQKNDIKRHLCRLLPVIKMPDHPTYAVMIHGAIEELNEKYGSTTESISKFIREKFDSLPLAHESFLNHHLKKLIDKGEIVHVSKDCYMLPSEKVDYPSRREHAPRQKQTQKGKGKRKPAKGNESKASAEEQVEVTEKQKKQGQRSEEPHYCKAFDDQAGSSEIENIQDKGQCPRNMEETAAIAVKQSRVHIEEDRQSKVDDQEGSPKAQQGELINQKFQDIAAIVVPPKQKDKVPEEQQAEVTEHEEQQAEVTEHEEQHGQESQERIREEQHCMVIDCQVEVTEQQQQHGKENQELLREEQHSMVIDGQNGSPDEENVQQHEVDSLKSQNQVQVPGVISEKQNIELTYKEDEVQVEVTEQLREDGLEFHKSIQAAQRSEMIEDKYGSADGQQNRVDGHENQKQMQEVSLIVGKQNVEVKKYEVSEEQVEVIEQQTELVMESEESKQHMMVIDCENGSSKQQNEQKDAVDGQQSENQMHITPVIVEMSNFSEQTGNMNEEEQVEMTEGQVQVTEQQDELTEQWREYGQQSQVATQEEQNSKVINCQNGSSKQQNELKYAANGQQSENKMHATAVVEMFNFSEQTRNANEEEQVEMTEEDVLVTEQQRDYGKQRQVTSQEEQNSKVIYCQHGSPEQQNKQQDDVNGDQLQENIVSCGKQIDTKQKLKVADEHTEVSVDKVIEEQCQTNEQSYEVIEQLSEAVKSDIQFHGEVVEAIPAGPKGTESDVIPGRNRLHDHFELTSMQKLLSKKQEKDLATLVKSNVSSNLSEMTCKLLENNITVQEKTQKLLESNIEVQEKRNKLLEDKIKVQKKNHKLLENNIKLQERTLQVQEKMLENSIKLQEKTIQVQEKLFEQLKEFNNIQFQEKTLQVQEKLFELLKELKDTNRSPVIEERQMPIVGPCGEREYIDCGFPAKKKREPVISAQTKALECQLNKMSVSVELPMDAMELFLKQGKLNYCQQRVPKFQNKSIKTHRDAEQSQEQEIGNSERLWELPTLEGDNEEFSGPVRKKICLRVQANHETEKQLQVHSSEVDPDILSKQPSASFCKCQGTKSAESDHGESTAPQRQEQQTRDPVQERKMVDHNPAEQTRLSSRGQGHSRFELSLSTSMVESSPRMNQDTERQTEEMTLKKLAEEEGQRQLQPRSNNLSESKHSVPSNTEMQQVEKSGVEVSSELEKQSQVENPGVGDSSQPKKNQVNCSNKRKLCAPESTTMPDAIGAIVTCQRGSDQTMDPNPEVVQDRPNIAETLSQSFERKAIPHGQQKKFKSKRTARESPDELSLTSQHHMVDPQILVKPPRLHAGAVRQLFQATKELLKEQHLLHLHHMKLHSCSQAASQSEADVSTVGQLPQTTNDLSQKQQMPWNTKRRLRSQAASQCEPDVMMIESPSSKHPCEQPQEQKHPKQPQKQRGTPPKPKLDRVGPVKRQKLQEEPKRRGRTPKSDADTISGRKVTIGKLQTKVRGKPQKVTQGTLKSQVGETEGTPKCKGRGRARKMTEGT